MGAAWSMLEPEEMRLASRDVCDDETWNNTVLNRSCCSVQERLHLLAWEVLPLETITMLRRERSGKRLEFAKHDSVRIFEKEDIEYDFDDQEEEEEEEEEEEIERHVDEFHAWRERNRIDSDDSDNSDDSPTSSLDNW